MKEKIKRIGFSLILISGLSSCNSDKGPATSEMPPQSLEIQNQDGTFQRVQSTERLSANSLIDLGLQGEALKTSQVLARTQCLEPKGQGQVHLETKWQHTSSLKIFQLLPVEVFKPAESGEWIAHCDLDIQIADPQGVFRRVQLKRIQIQMSGLLANLNSLPIKEGELAFLFVDQLNSINLDLSPTEVDAHLLCSQEHVQVRGYQAQLPLSQILEKLSWEDAQPQLCRLVLHGEKQNTYQWSPAFWLQGQAAEFETFLEPQLEADLYNMMADRPVATLHIRNQSSYAGWLRFPDLTGRFRLKSVYHWPIQKPAVLLSPLINASGKWEIDPRDLKRQLRGHGKVLTLQIPPGDSISLHLYANQNLKCHHGPLFKDILNGLNLRKCDSTVHFAGLNFEVNPSFKIEQNGHSLAPEGAWAPLKVALPSRKTSPAVFEFFSPFLQARSECPNVRPLSKIGQQPGEISSFAHPPRYCQWD